MINNLLTLVPQQLSLTPRERQLERQLERRLRRQIRNEVDRQRLFLFNTDPREQILAIPTPGITRPVEITVMVPTNNLRGDPILRYRYPATQSPPTQPPA